MHGYIGKQGEIYREIKRVSDGRICTRTREHSKTMFHTCADRCRSHVELQSRVTENPVAAIVILHGSGKGAKSLRALGGQCCDVFALCECEVMKVLSEVESLMQSDVDVHKKLRFSH